MAYEVLARKWRPRQFGEVAAQEHVTRTLENAIKTGRIAHAYLFVGPRGVGKTSLARIFAKALNCAEGPTITPCDKCDSCREIGTGNSLDVMEIDGASNNGVEQVRDLRENVKYAPTHGSFKIYVIDEVHMLSVAAFNALLKTLEEPPAHVKFIFATTEPQKLPATILSRCQRFDLRRIPAAVIVERLGVVAKAEGIEVDSNALLAVARGAEGSLRDAESALDQLISFRGNKIVEDDVLSVFGLVARRTLEGLAEAMLKADVPKLIGAVAELDDAGKDMQRLVVELLDHFRNVLVYLCAKDSLDAMDIVDDQAQVLAAHAALTSTEHVLRITDILIDTESRLRYALSRRTLIETALVRCARAAKTVSVDEIMAQIDRLKAQVGGAGDAGAVPAPAAEAEATPAGRYPAGNPLPESKPAAASSGPVAMVRESAAKSGAPGGAPGDEVELLARKWHEVVEHVARITPIAKNSLNDARPLRVEGDRVTVGFDPEFAADLKRIDSIRYRKAVQHVLGELLRRPVSVEFCVMGEDTKLPLPADQPVAADSATPPTPAQKRTRQEWLRESAVQKTLEIFNGTIVDIRE